MPLEVEACGCTVVMNTGDNAEWLDHGEAFEYVEPSARLFAERIRDLLKQGKKPEKQRKLQEPTGGLLLAKETDKMFQFLQESVFHH